MKRGAVRAALACLVLLAATAVTHCGYFNALYNAQQRFDDAQRAEAEGSHSAAIASYEAAIERAAVSYQKYPKSRWADDALLLIARSHFGRATNSLDEAADGQAVAALQRLLSETQDHGIRAQAFAYLGAARTRMQKGDAIVPLDSAVAMLDGDTDMGAFARLWRARARFAANDTAGAWADLDSIAPAPLGVRADASIERVMRALITADSARMRAALEDIAGRRGPSEHSDSVRALVRLSVSEWGPAFVNRNLPPDINAPLAEEDRLKLALLRAELEAEAGDTTVAITDAVRVAGASSSETAATARVETAQWLLATAQSPADLARIHSILVPAFASGEAVLMIRQIRVVDALIDRANTDPVAMFIAGEYARDELHAPRIARVLFLRMDSLPTRARWTGKALLSALDLSRTDAERNAVRQRIDAAPADIYTRTARGLPTDSTAFMNAEEELRHDTRAMRAEALAVATAGDVSVGRAITLRDSIRLVLRRDSIQQHCVFAIDSLKMTGIRADSSRVACIREDTARFNAVLHIDTMKLKPAHGDTIAFALARTLASRQARPTQ